MGGPNGNGKKEKKESTLGKFLSGVAAIPKKIAKKRILVAKAKIKNAGRISDGAGGVFVLDSPTLSEEQILDLEQGKPVQVATDKFDRLILAAAPPPRPRRNDFNNNNNAVDPATPVEAESAAGALVQLGASDGIVQEATGLSESETRTVRLKAQSSQRANWGSVGTFKGSASELTTENLSEFYAGSDDEDQGIYDVVDSDEFERLRAEIEAEDEAEEPMHETETEKTSEETSGEPGHV
jgi:hypothetical protein